jgi:ketose-bisphosphate aldolase
MGAVNPHEVIARAVAGGYAVGAFNMHNEETTEALVLAAEQAQSPVFLQIGRAFVPHVGLRRAFEMTKRIAEESQAEYIIHLDHGPWEEVFEAIQLGFGSIMYDGAHLPFEENIESTRRVVEVAHAFGIPVEAELGRIPDATDRVDDWTAYYTDVREAERFVAETGIDYLAISVGIVHGVPMEGTQPLDIERIQAIKEVTGIPLVLHGASGVPDDEVRAAMAAGVHKFNADTDLRLAFRAGMEAVWATGDRQLEEAMAVGRERMVSETVKKMDLYGCSGRAWGLSQGSSQAAGMRI